MGVSSLNRRLQRATEYVDRMWFPANPKLLSKLQQGLEDGVYDLDMEFLLLELKTDLAIYSRFLHQLARLLQSEGLPLPRVDSTLDFLKFAGVERVKQVLSNGALFRTDHTFDSLSPEQFSRLQEALITAVTAETMAEHSTVDPDSGFSAGVLRQLGLTLVAWNYPLVYKRVSSRMPEGMDLEEALSESLGFSPTALTLALIKNWALAPQVRAAITGLESEDGPNDVNAAAETLRTLCDVGEALARANNPEQYPQAAQDWDFALQEIVGRLGEDGLRLIQRKMQECTNNYRQYFPEVFAAVAQVSPAEKLQTLTDKQQTKQIRANQYLRSCRPAVAAKLNELYQLLQISTDQSQVIRHLVQNVVLSIGYSGGCVYVIDPTTKALVPRIKFGQVRLFEPKTLILNDPETRSSPVATAFFCNIPVVESITVGESTQRTYAGAALGRTRKVGVLYLETANAAVTTSAEDLHVFKAVREAFHDVLQLD